MYEVTEKILREVRKVIVGKDDVVEKVWISILAQGHVLLEDVPGVGKTTMALAFSKALGLETKRVQFTPDTMPSDIIGFSLPEQGRMVYQPGAVMTNLLLADEINRTSSKTQSALLEACWRPITTTGRASTPTCWIPPPTGGWRIGSTLISRNPPSWGCCWFTPRTTTSLTAPATPPCSMRHCRGR